MFARAGTEITRTGIVPCSLYLMGMRQARSVVSRDRTHRKSPACHF
jgi:hypothetical protein